MTQQRPPLLIYLHGFNSSPASYKAQQLRVLFDENGASHLYQIPALDFDPAMAMGFLEGFIKEHQPNRNITLIGSSLGGYYASFLTEKYGVRSVMINPVIAAESLFESYLGINTNLYNGEVNELTREHIDQLKQMAVTSINNPELYRVYLQTADETLDYRLAEDFYRNCPVEVETGGSHGYENFDRIIPEILEFANITI